MQVLSNDQLQRMVPSVFSEVPHDSVSARYTFIPTIGIIDALRNEGFMPVRAQQSASRLEDGKMFAKHMLRFRRIEDLENTKVVGTEIPELVMVNSHDRSSGFQLSAGLFRLICSNGMTVKSSNFGDISVRHTGDIRDNVIEGSYEIIQEMPAILAKVEQYKNVKLDPVHELAFADAALELRWPTNEQGNSAAPIRPTQLLNPRRSADNTNDLWTTFNRVQENFIKGGLRGTGTTGKRTTTRKIASVSEDLRLNKSLWLLTERMASILA
jgi:hypothetical protein